MGREWGVCRAQRRNTRNDPTEKPTGRSGYFGWAEKLGVGREETNIYTYSGRRETEGHGEGVRVNGFECVCVCVYTWGACV